MVTKLATSLVFEDLHNFDGVHTEYPFCNESVKQWNKALDGVEVDNAASICSGGEVSFFAILPKVKKKLVAIDHSYRSMYYAIGKYHVIEKLGAVKAHKLFKDARANKETLMELMAEANKDLPTNNARMKANLASPPIQRYGMTYPSREDEAWSYDSRILADLEQADLTAFNKARKRLHLLHGDLNDLVERGPFDLVYFSNALQYQGRDKKDNFRISEMVKPGGLICYTGAVFGVENRDWLDKLETLFSERNRLLDYGMTWTYTVKKAPA